MLETPVQQRRERAAETVERHAHALWLDHGGGGHGYLRGGSRALAVALADLLAQRGTPALGLGVNATCQIANSECGQAMSGLHVPVCRRGAGLEPESLAESAHLALACCPISHALSATVTHTIDVDLVGGM